MKRNDRCLRRSRWNPSMSQQAASIVAAPEVVNKEPKNIMTLKKNKNYSSQNNLGLGLTATAAQG